MAIGGSNYHRHLENKVMPHRSLLIHFWSYERFLDFNKRAAWRYISVSCRPVIKGPVGQCTTATLDGAISGLLAAHPPLLPLPSPPAAKTRRAVDACFGLLR